VKIFKFKAKISRPEGIGTWHFANVPIDVEKEYGKKGQVKVKASLNGKTFYMAMASTILYLAKNCAIWPV